MSEYIYEHAPSGDDATGNPVEAPTLVQREEIVRCRDCVHYTDNEMEYYHYCNRWCEQVEPDGFCKWGEHADPRTLEDVLRDLVDNSGSVDFDALKAIDESAAEIREMMRAREDA